MQFVDDDGKLNFYKPGHPVHSWYSATCSPHQEEECGPPLGNLAVIDLENSFDFGEAFTIGMPFAVAHFNGISVDWQTALVCQNSYLALGITKASSRKGDGSSHPDAFIVQAESRQRQAGSCDHQVDLDRGRKLAT